MSYKFIYGAVVPSSLIFEAIAAGSNKGEKIWNDIEDERDIGSYKTAYKLKDHPLFAGEAELFRVQDCQEKYVECEGSWLSRDPKFIVVGISLKRDLEYLNFEDGFHFRISKSIKERYEQFTFTLTKYPRLMEACQADVKIRVILD